MIRVLRNAAKPAYVSGLFLILVIVLSACAPVPTLASEDDSALRFVETPTYDLALFASRSIEWAEVTVTGYQLQIDSPFCVVESCVPDQNGFVRLLFPDEPDENYTRRLEVEVLDGVPIRGTAHAVLEAETLTRPATLKVQP